MIIEEKDFKLIQVSPDSIFWDLELPHVIKPKDKEPRIEFKNVGYGLKLDHAVRKIINYRINIKHSKQEAISMKDYMQDYVNYVKKLEYIFNYLKNENEKEKSL